MEKESILSDISLTGAQEQLIREVFAVGKPVVVVLVAGKPFAIPWVKENIPAILAQWYAGEQEGNSIADILFGNVNPSGKLTFHFRKVRGISLSIITICLRIKDIIKSRESYEKPGRDYVFSNSSPLWAFGYGLSYTQFEYLKAVTDKELYQANDTVCVTVQIENTGKKNRERGDTGIYARCGQLGDDTGEAVERFRKVDYFPDRHGKRL